MLTAIAVQLYYTTGQLDFFGKGVARDRGRLGALIFAHAGAGGGIREPYMLQFGARPSQAREMCLDDIYFLRLKLLLIMARGCLARSGMSRIGRRAMLQNARHVETESTALGHLDEPAMGGRRPQSRLFFDNCLYQCAKDIAIQVQRIARVGSITEDQYSALRKRVADISLVGGGTDFEPPFSLFDSVGCPSFNDN